MNKNLLDYPHFPRLAMGSHYEYISMGFLNGHIKTILDTIIFNLDIISQYEITLQWETRNKRGDPGIIKNRDRLLTETHLLTANYEALHKFRETLKEDV